MKLNIKSFALSCGILWGFGFFAATIWLMMVGAEGKYIELFGDFYYGYSFSIGGAFIGLVWGFIDGLIGGTLFSLLYNFLLPKESNLKNR